MTLAGNNDLDRYCLCKCHIVSLEKWNLILFVVLCKILSKPLTPTKAAWKTESSARPGANVEGIVTVKFCWGGPVEGCGGNCGLKFPLKRMVPKAWPGGRQIEFVVVHENSPITTPSSVDGVKVSCKNQLECQSGVVYVVNQLEERINLLLGQLVLRFLNLERQRCRWRESRCWHLVQSM